MSAIAMNTDQSQQCRVVAKKDNSATRTLLGRRELQGLQPDLKFYLITSIAFIPDNLVLYIQLPTISILNFVCLALTGMA